MKIASFGQIQPTAASYSKQDNAFPQLAVLADLAAAGRIFGCYSPPNLDTRPA